MNGSVFIHILVVWSAQISVLVLLAALAILTVTHPKARLWFWQALLLILMLLPLVEPWRTPLPEGIPAQIDDASLSAGVRQAALPPQHHWTSADWLWLIALGAALRLVWIVIGFLRLRRYRKEARSLVTAPVPFGSNAAEWYLHGDLSGPVTYGWLRPSILLPARFEQMEPPIQEAIACHELIHVIRRDWLFVIVEELIRSAFWFHPAVWFVLSRIQLAREQVVDRQVIRLIQDRDRYLDALVAVAAQKIQPDLVPAPLFLKKRHLASRVAAILQEVSMSRPRLYAALAAVCSAVFLAARLSVWLIPFSLPAQVQPDDPGVTVDPGAAILHRTPIHIPNGVKTGGTLVVEVSLNPKGEVSDARVLSGPEDLRKSTLESVLNWHYEAGLSRAEATIKFAGTGAPAAPLPPQVEATPAAPALPKDFNPTLRIDPATVAGSFPAILKNIRIAGLSADAEQGLRNQLPVHEGDSVRVEDIPGIFKAVGDFDSHLRTIVQVRDRGEFDLFISPVPTVEGLRQAIEAAAADSSFPSDFPSPEPGVLRIRVGGNVQATNLINKVVPKYPIEAKQARIQGIVRFNALIGTNGAMKELHLASGLPVLADAATDAVKQWVYRPTELNGNPVEVLTQIDVNFTLAK